MKHTFFLFFILISVVCCGCGKEQETDGLKDAGKIMSEQTADMIHTQSEPVIRETATASGVRAQLTDLQPLILYVSAKEDAITQIYDVYKATFTTSSGYQTERYMVAYYRNVEIKNPLSEDAVINSEPPICVGAMVEVAASVLQPMHRKRVIFSGIKADRIWKQMCFGVWIPESHIRWKNSGLFRPPFLCLFKGCSFPERRIQNFLADTQAFRSDLQKFIGIDKIKCLL